MPRAGLSPAGVTRAGAALADELGLPQLSMCLVADRLGVKTPSLYKHVSGQADLIHRIAVLATHELGEAMGDAVQGRAGSEALAAAAAALRGYAKDHPGRYALINSARPEGPDDPFFAAGQRALAPLSAVLHGYQLPEAQKVNALRTLRSMLHGFVTLEASAGFQLDDDVDDAFAWMISFLDHGLHAAAGAQTDLAAPDPAAADGRAS